MRIGDVGAVSPVGDLLAFSLAIVIVVSLVYSVETLGSKDNDEDGEEWIYILMTVRGWVGFDPDGDGCMELRPISELGRDSTLEFPISGRVTVTFTMGNTDCNYRFIDGSLDTAIRDPVHISLVHGCSVIVETAEEVVPALMEISFSAGDDE